MQIYKAFGLCVGQHPIHLLRRRDPIWKCTKWVVDVKCWSGKLGLQLDWTEPNDTGWDCG